MPNTETCLAAVFREPNEPMELRQVRITNLLSGEVLVRITCCTICGSDLHTFTGARSSPVPSVLGHEIIGVVDAIADTVSDVVGAPVKVGDRITWSVAASCGGCSRCGRGMPQKCESLFKYGHELCEAGSELSGGLAEVCVLKRGTAIVKLPDDLPDNVACPANCATATVAAAVRHAGDMTDRRILIYGAGMLGITTAAFSNAAGASAVVVCDVNEQRRKQAVQFGATDVTDDVSTDDFDCVFEMSGHPSAVESAINAAGIGGKVVLVGSVSPSPPVSVDPERIVRRLLTIHGVHNYRPDDLQTAVGFLQQHHNRYPFANLVEKTFGLEEVNEAFRYALDQRPIRVAVK